MQPALAAGAELICPAVSTAAPGKARWWTIELFRLPGGTYLAHRVAWSRVYHRPRTLCRTAAGARSGKPITALSELPENAEPCGRCNPPWPEELADSPVLISVRAEVPRHTWIEGTPEVITEALMTSRSRSGRVSVTVSEPLERLLEAAAAADPAFRRR